MEDENKSTIETEPIEIDLGPEIHPAVLILSIFAIVVWGLFLLKILL